MAEKNKEQSRMLLSMDEIEAYTGRSRQTIRKWVEDDNFPAVKIDGRWESRTDLIDAYRERRINRLVGSGSVSGSTAATT